MRVLIDRLKNLSGLGIAALIAVPVFAGLAGFVLVARAVNTSPAQCASCHPEMTTLWKKSVAHPAERVTCYQCHAAHAELPNGFNLPGYVRDLLIPEKYMASVERIEGRCLECHREILGAETERTRLIKVNHKAHLAKPLLAGGVEKKLGCLDCHGNVAHDRKALATNRPTMKGCFASECHTADRKAESCQRCHYQTLLDRALAGAAEKQAEGAAH